MAAIESLVALEKEVRALIRGHETFENQAEVLAMLEKQRASVLGLIKDPDSGLVRSDLKLFSAALRDDLNYRIDAQMSGMSAEGPTASARRRVELKSTLQALNDFQPEFEKHVGQNLDEYLPLLKDSTSTPTTSLLDQLTIAQSAFTSANRAAARFGETAAQLCFSDLPVPLCSALTDMEGRFQITLPLREIVVAAKGTRTLSNGSVERYFWFVRLTPGQIHAGDFTLANANMMDSGSPSQAFNIPVIPVFQSKAK